MKRRRILAVLLLALMLGSIDTDARAYAAAAGGTDRGRILYLVGSGRDREMILSSDLAAPYLDLADVEVMGGGCSMTEFDYGAIAAPYQFAGQLPLKELFENDVEVYLYGAVTVSGYTEALGIDAFEVERPVYDQTGAVIGSAFQRCMDTDGAYSVIGLNRSRSDGLLCRIDGNTVLPQEYFHAVLKHIASAFSGACAPAIIGGQFDIVSYYYHSYASTHLDYQIYRDTGELDPDHDYYALRTKVWGECEAGHGIIDTVGVKHEAAVNDHIYAHQPSAQPMVSFDLGISIAAFSKRMAITLAADYTNDIVEWTMRRAAPYIGSGDIADEVLMTGISWATAQGGAPMGTIYYRSIRTNSNSTGLVTQDWQTARFGFYEA